MGSNWFTGKNMLERSMRYYTDDRRYYVKHLLYCFLQLALNKVLFFLLIHCRVRPWSLAAKADFQTFASLYWRKLVSAIFYQIFIFPPNDNSSEIMKNLFLSHLKSSFRCRDIQFFVIFSFLSKLSRFKRPNGSGIIYDVMNWLA